jgi:phosphatidylserine decarboxylase
MIKFGSRVEVYLPPEWEVLIKKGERVKAGETIMARMGTGDR